MTPLIGMQGDAFVALMLCSAIAVGVLLHKGRLWLAVYLIRRKLKSRGKYLVRFDFDERKRRESDRSKNDGGI